MKKISSKTSDVFGIWENRSDITDDWIDKKRLERLKYLYGDTCSIW